MRWSGFRFDRSAACRGGQKSESEMRGRVSGQLKIRHQRASYEAEFSDSGSSSVSSVACTKASEAVLTIMSSFEGCLNLTRGMEISRDYPPALSALRNNWPTTASGKKRLGPQADRGRWVASRGTDRGRISRDGAGSPMVCALERRALVLVQSTPVDP
jgi:hypothetical protein